ncbi:hypothetical protein [Streptomyces mirabilis]|uniref:Uncharacterized protein n=1 Tax=Streptomyces mirabilis TaxID=68239 RepID=A0ABU3V4U2_9ACTN|nr:hypothetical protein [Streptomyces mirabilis]MCX5355546.1 hypothetical protein [Streptomyces mirabilis]MDU9001193.1 hypothetical protein [Streptomyces mirabilis]
MEKSKSEAAAQGTPVWAEAPGVAAIIAPTSVVRIEDVEDEGP